jgi:DNA-binding LacI/PurR family transcriptional regulator
LFFGKGINNFNFPGVSQFNQKWMKKGQVTIKDIAKELGISPSTVSKALKGHHDISSSTKKAVRELVERWHYKPDPIALSLKGGKSRTIGVIVPEIVHYFFSTVISGIEDIAYASGYHVMFCQSNESYEREVKSVETLLSSRVDGILVSLAKTTADFEHLSKIMESGIPLVLFDRVCDDIDCDKVVVDDEEGAFNAVKHLIETGCRNIVHLSGPQNLMIGQERKNGFLRAIKNSGIKMAQENIIKCDTPEEAKIIIPDLLKRKRSPDGIFAVNDLTAAETMKIIKSHGLNVPGDIALIGFTSGMISDLTDPQLTSVEQHGYEMGKKAVEMLITRLEKKHDLPFRTAILKTELVIKGSTGKRLMD